MRLPTIIGLDVDEVLADLHTPWIVWLNMRFSWNRNPSDGFADWDEPIRLFGKQAYEFLTPDIYTQDIVRPFPGAFAAVQALRERGHGIRFCTSCSPGSEDAKFRWLVRWGFLKDFEEFIPGRDKSQVKCHVLVDDGFHNVSTFKGWGILVSRPHNDRESWQYRVNGVSDLLAYC